MARAIISCPRLLSPDSLCRRYRCGGIGPSLLTWPCASAIITFPRNPGKRKKSVGGRSVRVSRRHLVGRAACAIAFAVIVCGPCACVPRQVILTQAASATTGVPTPQLAPALTATPSASPVPSVSPTRAWTPTVTASHTAAATQPPSATDTDVPVPTLTEKPTPTDEPRVLRVPILMYHYISAPPEGADKIRLDLSVPPHRFEEHLAFLRGEGYTTITLYDLAIALRTNAPLPEKPVILTFDDGYREHYTEAFPLLGQYGYVGTFFVITNHLDQEHEQYLSWDHVVEMHEAGMEIESHSYTHVDLRDRSVDYLVWQMLGSREAIEARIERPVRFFCYPAGKYDYLAIQVLASADYWGAVTIEPGVVHCSESMFEMRRIRVHGRYDARALGSAIRSFMSAPEEASPCTMTL